MISLIITRVNMDLKLNKEKIHCWDADAIVTALFRAAVIEGFAIAPLVIFGMGHAGPNGGLLGYLSLFLNIPGLMVAAFFTDQKADFSWLGFCAKAFLTQFILLGYLIFILIRRKRIYQTTTIS
jgi:hypothetical protein